MLCLFGGVRFLLVCVLLFFVFIVLLCFFGRFRLMPHSNLPPPPPLFVVVVVVVLFVFCFFCMFVFFVGWASATTKRQKGKTKQEGQTKT